MDAKALLARAEKHRALNQHLQDTPGSGYHDRDVDPSNRARLVAPQHQRNPHATDPKGMLPPIGEHLIVYHGPFERVLVGPCAKRAYAVIRAWYDKHKGRPPTDMTGAEQMLVYRIIPGLQAPDGDPPLLVLHNTWWNLWLGFFYSQGLGITGAPLVADGTTP